MKLYLDVLGEGVDPYVGSLPPDEDMAESCRRYILQRRCPGPQGITPLPGDMTIEQLTAEVVRLAAELHRLRAACSLSNEQVGQTLGRALGYPRFCDDPKNFPDATDADGVCVGVHVAETLVEEAAARIRKITAERDNLKRQLLRLNRIVITASRLTYDEIKAMEQMSNSEACIAFDAWNAKNNTEANCREMRELRAERKRLVALLQSISLFEPDPLGIDPYVQIAKQAREAAHKALAFDQATEHDGRSN